MSIFARELTDNLASLVKQIDEQVAKHEDRKMAAFVVILAEDADTLAPKREALAKKQGISDQTVYAWRKRFGKLEAADVKRLRQLEHENLKLKKLVAERDLEIEAMREVAAKKW